MRLDRILSLADHGVALDTETHLIQPGNLAPRLVCASVAVFNVEAFQAQALKTTIEEHDRRVEIFEAALLGRQDALDLFLTLIRDRDKVILGAYIAYDLLVLAFEWAARGVDVMPDIFAAFQDERIFDLQIAESLHAIAQGHLGDNPATGKSLVNRETGRRGSYSLDNCVELVLGRTDAKENDEWRLRYAELENVPMDQWPIQAREYPKDDVRNSAEVALAQAGHLPKVTVQHEWGPKGCTVCGATKFGQMCVAKRRHRNLHDHANQVWTAFCLHLGAAWGFCVDQAKVDVVEEYAVRKREGGIAPFKEAGIIREDGSVNEAVLKKRVALAYGATDPCPVCKGEGKIPHPNPKMLQCPECKGRSAPWKWGGEIRRPTITRCDTCKRQGKVVDVRHKITCQGPDGETTCDGTGLKLNETIPKSDTGRIGKGADALHESLDNFLMSYGDFTEDAKWLKDYVPYLREARKQLTDGSYVSVPLTLKPNAILETGRVSYRGYIQLFPRWPGFKDKKTGKYIPSFRECIVARPGRILSSQDFKAGELVTHAQSCKWIVGYSDLGDVLLSKDTKGRPMDPHSMLASTVLGVTYEEFVDNLKLNPRFKDARQASKPENFGKPGGMGDPKLVWQQRVQGPDTPHHTGTSLIEDEDGNIVPGYNGLRFCILMGGDGPCGKYKVDFWNDRPIRRVCAECLERAVWLGQKWKEQWRENRPYFRYVSNCVENGQRITHHMLDRWSHLAEYFIAGEKLAPGEIMQHVSGRIRQVTGGDASESPFCKAANGFFQGLLSDITKHAYRIATMECYVRGLRVPDMLFHNSIPSKYAGCDSPLFGSRIPGFFHDELFGDHPASVASDAAWRMSEIMQAVMRYYCPDYADAAEAEPTLMFAWDKRAAKVVHGGKLVPWTPEHNPKTCTECKAG